MNIDGKQIKANAWQSITNTTPSPFIAAIVMVLLNSISNIINQDTSRGFLVVLVSLLINTVVIFLGIGYQWYSLNVSRNQSPEPLSMLEIFSSGRFGKVVQLYLLVLAKVFLWSLLFIIPGIVKAYSYSQSFYILYDNPDWTPSQCIEESKRMMQGNKAELFAFQLSFIGWFLVGFIAVCIVVAIVSIFSATLANVLGALILVPLYAYMFTANAGFYQNLYMYRYAQY